MLLCCSLIILLCISFQTRCDTTTLLGYCKWGWKGDRCDKPKYDKPKVEKGHDNYPPPKHEDPHHEHNYPPSKYEHPPKYEHPTPAPTPKKYEHYPPKYEHKDPKYEHPTPAPTPKKYWDNAPPTKKPWSAPPKHEYPTPAPTPKPWHPKVRHNDPWFTTRIRHCAVTSSCCLIALLHTADVCASKMQCHHAVIVLCIRIAHTLHADHI
eukprot:20017-Heterococcus_DN1.PRE.1